MIPKLVAFSLVRKTCCNASERRYCNEQEGKDTGIMRTTRLFYVACTRAQKSLAVLAYTENAEAVKRTAILNGWFTEDEVHIL